MKIFFFTKTGNTDNLNAKLKGNISSREFTNRNKLFFLVSFIET